MYIKDATYRSVPTADLTFPIAEGTVVTVGNVTGIVVQNLTQASPTARIYVAVGGTIDLTSDANKNVTFSDEDISRLGQDFNFIPGAEGGGSSLPSFTSSDVGKVLTVGEDEEHPQTINIVPPQTVVLTEDDIAAELTGYDFDGVSIGDTLTFTVDGHSETVTVITGGGVELAVAATYSVEGGQQTVQIGYVTGTGAGFDCLFRGTGGDTAKRKPGTYTVSITKSVPSVAPVWQAGGGVYLVHTDAETMTIVEDIDEVYEAFTRMPVYLIAPDGSATVHISRQEVNLFGYIFEVLPGIGTTSPRLGITELIISNTGSVSFNRYTVDITQHS